ncbi:hypothetical protein FOZ60_011740 [Perkinsus olseni]|uniref:J domain-containing protein n=1 Tax=Perkinsus olseni TaxID=32597 RepID=A0A7J6NCL0_PEROL|nr:hypothetical protein FOZ60_011740 [Perkinsus olseni]
MRPSIALLACTLVVAEKLLRDPTVVMAISARRLAMRPAVFGYQRYFSTTGKKDPYSIMGVSPAATQKEIKEKFRELAKKYHPDRNPNDPEAQSRMASLTDAYAILTDPKKRAIFDREQREMRNGSTGSGTTSSGASASTAGDWHHDPSQMFSEFSKVFGRQAKYRQAGQVSQRGDDITTEIEVLVSVPAGARQFTELRLPGLGHCGLRGGRSGDLFVTIKVKEHERFKRVDEDVHLTVPVSLSQALLGGTVEIPSLTSEKDIIKLQIPPNTLPGNSRIIRGKGPPKLSAGKLVDRLHLFESRGLFMMPIPEFDDIERESKQRREFKHGNNEDQVLPDSGSPSFAPSFATSDKRVQGTFKDLASAEQKLNEVPGLGVESTSSMPWVGAPFLLEVDPLVQQCVDYTQQLWLPTSNAIDRVLVILPTVIDPLSGICGCRDFPAEERRNPWNWRTAVKRTSDLLKFLEALNHTDSLDEAVCKDSAEIERQLAELDVDEFRSLPRSSHVQDSLSDVISPFIKDLITEGRIVPDDVLYLATLGRFDRPEWNEATAQLVSIKVEGVACTWKEAIRQEVPFLKRDLEHTPLPNDGDFHGHFLSNPCLVSLYPNHAKICAVVMYLPTSTATVERCFSTTTRLADDHRPMSGVTLTRLMRISEQGHAVPRLGEGSDSPGVASVTVTSSKQCGLIEGTQSVEGSTARMIGQSTVDSSGLH